MSEGLVKSWVLVADQHILAQLFPLLIWCLLLLKLRLSDCHTYLLHLCQATIDWLLLVTLNNKWLWSLRAFRFVDKSLKLLICLRVHLTTLKEIVLSIALGLHDSLGLLQDLKLLLRWLRVLLFELLLMHLLRRCYLHLCGDGLVLRLSNLAALL